MDKKTLHTVSPITGEICWSGVETSLSEVNAAVETAKTHFLEWAKLPLSTRISYVEAFQKKLEEYSEPLAKRIALEIGKPLWEARQEVQTMVLKVTASIEAHHDRCPSREKSMGSGVSVTRHRPHGVSVILGPYNFPGHIPNGHIVPALIAGNTIVFKPSDKAAFVSELMMRIWQESGLPTGVLVMVQGKVEVAQSLIDHPDVRAIFFTGSSSVGLDIQKRCLGTGKLLALEMGGNNPMIVSSYADVSAAAFTVVQSAFLSSGQRCTSLRRLFIVDKPETSTLLSEVLALTDRLNIGGGENAYIGSMVSQEAALSMVRRYDGFVKKGARVLRPLTHLGGAFLSPGILDVSDLNGLEDVECFGPLILTKKVSDFESGLKEANATRFGLSAAVLSTQREEFDLALSVLRAGIVNWNGPSIGASPYAPFGGLGLSGNFHPSAYYAADYCSYPVASIEHDRVSVPSHLPPGVLL